MQITLRNDHVEIEGYVNAVGRDSRIIPDDQGYPMREQIQPGSFAASLAKRSDVKILLDHNDARVLGDTNSGLTLEEDTIGLHADAVVTDPEVMQLARDGKLQGWSFGFMKLDSKDEYTSDCHRSIVTELDLVEVSLIDDKMTPCYAGTSVHARANGETEQILIRANDDIISRADETTPAEPDTEPDEPVDYSDIENTIAVLNSTAHI